ncbi:Hypothetical predicted protein [Xyrichtys novacula]|uniref:Uncharacterized protein n=1 Tax=Xyrichtys novacula TaxID=13765 RepID=A0AAV1GZK8_XYRNO|nr:Hypothetical predicted protein [Xyrichtys novacula]
MIEAWVMFTHRRGSVRGRRWRVCRQRGDSRLKGHSVYQEEERLRDIDVRREERDEERQLGMKRDPLVLQEKGMMKGMRDRNGESLRGVKSHGGEETVEGKTETRESNENRKANARFFDVLETSGIQFTANSLLSILMREELREETEKHEESFTSRWYRGIKTEREKELAANVPRALSDTLQRKRCSCHLQTFCFVCESGALLELFKNG